MPDPDPLPKLNPDPLPEAAPLQDLKLLKVLDEEDLPEDESKKEGHSPEASQYSSQSQRVVLAGEKEVQAALAQQVRPPVRSLGG